MLTVERVDAATARRLAPDLARLLKEGVDEDHGLGFLPPLDPDAARAHWEGVARDVAAGERVLLVARLDGRTVGSAQLELCLRPNGRHRAEVQKVMVLASARRRGVGRALMAAVDEWALKEGRSLLHLDTFEGSVAEGLYRACGWSFSGRIPRFALRADGRAHATAVYYKLLG